ncbi:34345_t:CDS:2, partial [Racocetra persica]
KEVRANGAIALDTKEKALQRAREMKNEVENGHVVVHDEHGRKVTEDKDNIYVEIDLPGIKKEETKIEVYENILRISGNRKEKLKRENAKQHYSEVFYGSFTREFVLPAAVEKEKIKARYEDGVLFIAIPKTTKGQAQIVEIE